MWAQFKPVEVPRLPFIARRPVSSPLPLIGWLGAGVCMGVHNTPRPFPHAFIICCRLGKPSDGCDFACALSSVLAPDSALRPPHTSRLPSLSCMPALQISSPSGRAVFQVTAGLEQETDLYADVAVCLTPDLDMPVGDGTVTAYRNESFIW